MEDPNTRPKRTKQTTPNNSTAPQHHQQHQQHNSNSTGRQPASEMLMQTADYPYKSPHPKLGQRCCALNLKAIQECQSQEMPIVILYMGQHPGSQTLNPESRIVLGAEPGLGYAIRIHVSKDTYERLERKLQDTKHPLVIGSPIGLGGHFQNENFAGGVERNGMNFQMQGEQFKTDENEKQLKEFERGDKFFIEEFPKPMHLWPKCKRFASVNVVISKLDRNHPTEVICPPGTENKLALRVFPGKKGRPMLRMGHQYRLDYIDIAIVDGIWTLTYNGDVSTASDCNGDAISETQRRTLDIESVNWGANDPSFNFTNSNKEEEKVGT